MCCVDGRRCSFCSRTTVRRPPRNSHVAPLRVMPVATSEVGLVADSHLRRRSSWERVRALRYARLGSRSVPAARPRGAPADQDRSERAGTRPSLVVSKVRHAPHARHKQAYEPHRLTGARQVEHPKLRPLSSVDQQTREAPHRGGLSLFRGTTVSCTDLHTSSPTTSRPFAGASPRRASPLPRGGSPRLGPAGFARRGVLLPPRRPCAAARLAGARMDGRMTVRSVDGVAVLESRFPRAASDSAARSRYPSDLLQRFGIR